MGVKAIGFAMPEGCVMIMQRQQFYCRVLFLMAALVQVTPVLARSDDRIQRDVEARIAESSALDGAPIEVHVVQQLLLLTGQVRLYAQKLVCDRIAWATPGVKAVDNELQVVPKVARSDEAIERRIRAIVKTDERFYNAAVKTRVEQGNVFVSGSFLRYRDPSILKHKVAEIEGVIEITISAAFLARNGSP